MAEQITKSSIRIVQDGYEVLPLVRTPGAGVWAWVLEAEFETWFDVDEKFGLNTKEQDGVWVNLYARFEPTSRYIDIIAIESGDDFENEFEASGFFTPEEINLFWEVAEESIRHEEGCSIAELIQKESALRSQPNAVYVSRIDWDTDGKDVKLPAKTIVFVPENVEDVENYISEYLSDKYGFCHRGFCIEG